ncbi:MAG: hypothetical protein ACYC55_10245, partial [Candidatus Geothermincolia bacterium]
GGYFISKAELPRARLVQVVEVGDPDVINGTVVAITGLNEGYDTSGCVIEAVFDPTGHPAGDYRFEVVNTQPTILGHVAGQAADLFRITTEQVQVNDAYSDAYLWEYGYNNQGNPWTLRITGLNFNMEGTPPLEVYLASAIVDGLPAGSIAQGAVLEVTGNNSIRADFDLSGLPAGDYYCFVRNSNNGLADATNSALFQVRSFVASITGFATNPGIGFFENYYDIPATLAGTGLADASAVKITNGTVTYDVTADATMGGDTSISMMLNLIGCEHGNWRVQAWWPWGTYLEQGFAVTLGRAIILPASDLKPAIKIEARRGLSTQWNIESTSAPAWAWRTTTQVTGYATFEVYGKGFPLTGANTRLRVWQGTWEQAGNCAVVFDRANKQVKIVSPAWSMLNKAGDCGISVNATVGDKTVDSYTGRWYLSN